jgi:shikimate dehydrogenase
MQYGLIGERLVHSFSKEIHNNIADYPYELKELRMNEVADFLKKRDFKGINVTIPYKETVMEHLDFISSEAKKIGAVNTVVNKNGILYGYNTDYLGLKALIEKADIEIRNKKVLVLGSGGTSKTARAVLEDMSAREILSVSRKESHETVGYETALKYHSDADVIINTTPVGMFPNVGVSPIDISGFKNLSGVVDVIYNPLGTELVQRAKEGGIKAVNGLYMLVSQAVFAYEKFFGIRSDKTDEIYNQIKAEKQNIVLIGMASCGKSTVGRVLSEMANRPLFDSDSEIVSKENREITEIFRDLGEGYFRDAESKTIAELSLKGGCIIATGGGSVLRKENVKALKQNGKLYFLDRPLEKLICTPDRPLSGDKEALRKRYFERLDIYEGSADKIISGDSTPEETAKIILKHFLNEDTCD